MRKSPNKNSPDPAQDLSRKRLGDYGERLAVRWYKDHGFEILATQWHTAGGELDVVAFDGKTIVFCEVKTRRSNAFGSPLESVTYRKQKRVRDSASAFLANTDHPYAEHIRFDVAAVVGSKLNIFEDAF